MILQALVVLGGLIEAVITVHATTRTEDLDGLLRVATPFGEVDGPSLSSLPSCVHHIVDLPLRSPRLVPHLSYLSSSCEERPGQSSEQQTLNLALRGAENRLILLQIESFDVRTLWWRLVRKPPKKLISPF